MADEAMEQFLFAGINRYAEALDTIQSFEELLKERLRGIMKAFSCDVFTPNKTQISTGLTGRAVWAVQEGVLRSRPTPVWLELGVWWNEGTVAFYCGFIDAANKDIEFKYLGSHHRIEFRKWGKKARLFMVASSDPGTVLASELKLILNELIGSFQ